MLARVWRGLRTPSLSRRLVLALAAGLVLVALEILAWEYASHRWRTDDYTGLSSAAEAFSGYLLAAPEADRVVMLRTLIEDINHWRRDDPERWPGEVAALWLGRDGQVIYESHPRLRQALLAQGAGRGVRELDERMHWACRLDSELGSLRMVEPQRSAEQVVQHVAPQLRFYLLIAFPVALLPIWLAVYRGLRPLREFVQRLAERDAQDLRPLAVRMPQVELQPLGQAFDAMLERLRRQRERERQFVQEAAHELRTPLAVIGAQAHALRWANDAEQREQAAQALDGAVARAAHLSRQLLTLASVESLETALPEQAADLAEQTRAQLAELLPLAEARGIGLALDAPDQLPSHIPLPLWRSLLGNLVDNALRYCPPGSRIEVSLGEQAGALSLRVADDGPGIAPADWPRVFERFWRADQTQASGTGLGLAIVRQVVLSLGGRIKVGPGLNGRGVAFHASGLAPSGAPELEAKESGLQLSIPPTRRDVMVIR